MSAPGLLAGYLTEFDDRISSEINLDPLGLQVIWSAYGQAIFQGRISSISNDVRNYTINLFNHRLAKSLVEDDSLTLGRGLQHRQTYAGKKDSQAFKQACLIHLENLFTFAMVEAEAQGRTDVTTTGVLGILKARRQWEEKNSDPTLVFSHREVAHLLTRQTSLGVSGRYKTPLVQLKFFDSAYDYALPTSRDVWRQADEQLFAPSRPLAKLHALALAYMKALLSGAEREPQRQFSAILAPLKKAFVQAFKAPPAVGDYARDFWLSVTGLHKGASGALYQVLEQEFQAGLDKAWPAHAVFVKAGRHKAIAGDEQVQLLHVMKIEPFLGELDLLLHAMLSAKTQSLNDVATKWAALGRNDGTLGSLAKVVADDPYMRAQVTGTASTRLGQLIKLAQARDVRQQILGLLTYHEKIMAERGQPPWLRLLRGTQLKLDVGTRDLPGLGKRPVGEWTHHYYIPQFRLLLSGLRGMA